MKLKLPLALLVALFAFVNTAVAVDDASNTESPESSSSKMVNDATGYNSYKYTGANNTRAMCCYLTQDAEYTENHDYYDNKNSTLLNVGALGKDASLSVTGDGTVVNVGGHLYVAGKGYGQGADVAPGSGYVFVGKGASLNVGAHPENYGTDLTQLQVGAPDGATAEMVVEGTVTSRGMIILAGGTSDTSGKIRVQNGGRLALHVTDNIKSGTPQVVIGSTAGSNALIEVDNQSTFEITTTETRQCDVTTWIGSSGNGTLDVRNGSTVNLATGYGSNIVYMGVQAGTMGAVNVDSSTLTTGTAYVGYAGTGDLVADNQSVVNVNGDVYLGAGQKGQGAISLSSGTEATIQGTTYVGYNYNSKGVVTLDNASMSAESSVFVGAWGSGEMTISNGADMSAAGQLVIGYQANSTASVVVDGTGSNLTAGGTTFLGYSENSGSLSLTNGASADLQYVQATGTSTVSITGGSTAKVGSGIDGMYIGENAKLIVEDGATAASSLQVEGILGNEGTLQANLSQGGSVSALAVENTGTMEVTLDKGAEFSSTLDVSNSGTMTVSVVDGSFKALEVNNLENGTLTVTVGNGASYEAATVNNSGTMDIELKEGATMAVDEYVNAGNSTITAAEGTTCRISSLDLSGGSMKLDGDGEFNLGGSAEGENGLSSTFHVSGLTTTTNIDISLLVSESVDNLKFTINDKSVFTLNFTAEALANIKEGEEATFTLTLVAGYEGFSVEEGTLSYLLDNNTRYVFETAPAFAADASAGAADYVVEEAQYLMVGNDLVWTGTVKGIPEPATATLSLLALAALAARRRRGAR